MKYIFAVAFIIFWIDSRAQHAVDDYVFQQLIGKSYSDESLTHKGIFFLNSYLPGKVFFQSGDSVEGIYIRYNSLEDKLLWLNKDYGQIMLDKKSISAFEIRSGDTVYLFKKHLIKNLNDITEHFYQEYPGQNIMILVLRKVNKVSTYFTKNKQYFVYEPNPQYVLIVNSRELVLSGTKIKSVYQLFPEKKERISSRLKQNPVKIKSENDFINFIRSIEDILVE